MIEAHDLAFRYPGSSEPAVGGVTFSVKKGEIFGLLGPNGAGKTTTISMLSCLLTPTGGSATVAGFDLERQATEVKRRIGLVPQDIALYPTLSAAQNLQFFGRIYGLSGRALETRVLAALEVVGLVDRAPDTVQTYSGGMKRRLNIAAGLLHEPEVLFLDEPTVGVDPQSRNFIFEGVQALSRDGLTIVYTTHYMEEAERLCQRVAIVDAGQVVALDTPEALIQSLGGGRIVLGIAEDVPETVDNAVGLVPGVLGVKRVPGQLVIESQQAARVLVDVLEAIAREGASVGSVEITQPSLESVFLTLTGKRLRD